MSDFKPRYYQTECVEAFLRDAKKFQKDNLLAALPTGSGKSCIIGMLAKEIADRGGRVLVVARSKELLQQNWEKYTWLDPDGLSRAGIYSAGLDMRQLGCQVTFGGVQSICKRSQELGKVDAIIADECHQISFNPDSQYRTLISGIRSVNPKARFFGLTATPFRTDGVIHGSERSLFDRMSYVVPLSDMFDNKWLTRPITLPSDQVDMTGVKIVAGEYNQGETQSKFLEYWNANNKTVEILQSANKENRKSCMVFCTGVAHANLVHQELLALGETAAIVTGETLPIERSTSLADFTERRTRWMVNVDVLTTGFDATGVDYIVAARATQSAGLFSQIIGRGLRLHDGKSECFVTDFGGNVDRFGAIDSPTYGEGFIKEPSGVEGQPPMRVCPNCFEIFPAGKNICPKCGIELPKKEKVMLSTTKAITVETTKHTVVGIDYKLWKGKETESSDPSKPAKKKPDTMLVQYRLSVPEDAEIGKRKRWAREWVCIEHKGYAREKAVKWWKERSSDTEPPETIAEALALIDSGALRDTMEISIRPDGKWDRIVDHVISEDKAFMKFPDNSLPF